MTKIEKPVSKLTHLPNYNKRGIDVPPSDLNFSAVGLHKDDEIYDIYKRLAISLGALFEDKGLVEIESYVYNTHLHGKVIHNQVNVLGRCPETGQLYSIFLM